MSLRGSYFELPNPFALVERWFNPQRHLQRLMLRDQPLEVSWTERAERQLQQLDSPLLAEMQLYFSCVVKKRVLFHPQPPNINLGPVKVNDRLQVAFRAVQATSCDPVEFAANFPVQREFETQGASKMHPKGLQIDYRNGEWMGAFNV